MREGCRGRRAGQMGSALDLGALRKLTKDDDTVGFDLAEKGSEEDDDFTNSKLEDQLTNETLKKLEKTFEEADIDGGGGLDMEEFRFAMRQTLGEHLTDQELDRMFMKVDTNCDGTVDWDEYLGYMLLEYSEKDKMNFLARRRPFPKKTQPVNDLQHYQRGYDNFVNILYYPTVKKYDNVFKPLDDNVSPGKYVTTSKDGVINFWSMDLKHVKRFQLERKERGSIWVTVAAVMPNANMIAIATTNSLIAFYEINMNLFAQKLVMTDMEIAITSMHYWFDPIGLDQSILMWGDLRGNIYIMNIEAGNAACPLSPSHASRREDKISLTHVHQGIVTGLSLSTIHRAHKDQVVEIHYYSNLDMFMSCSRDRSTALLLSDVHYKRPTYFQQNKGAYSFDFSLKHNFIVSGGRDTIVRVWSPFVVSKPVMSFQGHKQAVTFVRVDEELEQVISVSSGKDVLIFDLNTQTCIQNIFRKFVNLGVMPLASCYYNRNRRALLLASNKLVIFQHKDEEWTVSQPHSHSTGVTCVLFNPLFHQVVSGDLDSLVMVWDVMTGEKIVQFTAHQEYIHGEEHLIPISAMCFDSTQRRLATAARNGSIKLWNFNNGACLREVEEGNPANLEVTALAWPLNRLFAVGWSQKLICYMDSAEDEAIHECQKLHVDDVVAMAFKEPSTLATASIDGDIFLWSLDTLKPMVHFNIAQSLKAQSCRKLIYHLENSVKSESVSDDSSDLSGTLQEEDEDKMADLASRSHGAGDIEESTNLAYPS